MVGFPAASLLRQLTIALKLGTVFVPPIPRSITAGSLGSKTSPLTSISSFPLAFNSPLADVTTQGKPPPGTPRIALAHQFMVERGSLQSWLLTIARRTALDRIRMESRRPILSDATDPEEHWQSIPEASSLSEENRWRSMALVVQALPLEQRQVIDLAYYQGLSQSEIAETLGWPLGTVKTRLRAAMEQLRAAWGGK